jgi:hypothetical protein
MIKKSLLVTLSIMLLFSFSAFAGEGSDTVGGGKLLPQLRYGYSVFDWETHSIAATDFEDWDITAHNYFAQLNWGVLNNLDLIALVGGRSLSLSSDYQDRFYEEFKARSVPAFMWGLGFRTTFFRADNGLYVGGGALFTHSFTNDFDLKYYEDGVLDSEYRATLSAYMLTPEIHAGLHIKDTGLTPYLGADYTWSRAVTEIDGGGDIESRLENPFFMFVGIDYLMNDRLYLNVEGRSNFVDGWGVEAGIGYMFDICAKPAPPVVEPAPPIEPKLEPMSKN